MALDEPKNEDKTAEEKGYKFCIDPQLLAQISRVTINFSFMGFTVEPEKPLNLGGGGCSACSVSGGCATSS